MAYEQEILELTSSPSAIAQHAGCCGFASTVIALAQFAPRELEALLKTTWLGSPYRDVPNSDRVAARVMKRITSGALPAAKVSTSAQLSIALMILLKEYLKERDPEMWDSTLEFSDALFNVNKADNLWIYGDKLKAAPDAATLAFSYKHGDLALTVPATEMLLRLVGLGLVESFPLLDTAQLAGKANLWPFRGHADLKKGLQQIQDWVNGGTYAGAFIGLAKLELVSHEAFAAYGYLAHWVYVPKQARPVDPWHADAWTWGATYTLLQLHQMARQYVPVVAVVFKKPGSGTPFA